MAALFLLPMAKSDCGWPSRILSALEEWTAHVHQSSFPVLFTIAEMERYAR